MSASEHQPRIIIIYHHIVSFHKGSHVWYILCFKTQDIDIETLLFIAYFLVTFQQCQVLSNSITAFGLCR